MKGYALAAADRAAKGAGPFALFERALAGRYLRAKRAHGGVALISIISFAGITLAVGILIIVMSVMNGFRIQLVQTFLGVEGHIFLSVGGLPPSDVTAVAERVRAVPGVTSVTPVVTSPVLILNQGGLEPAFVIGVGRQDFEKLSFVSTKITEGGVETFGEGRNGGDEIIIGDALKRRFGLGVGEDLVLMAPAARVTAVGALPPRKPYVIGAVYDIGMAEYERTLIYMPLEQAQIFLGKRAGPEILEVRVAKPDSIERVQPAVTRAAGVGVFVENWKDRRQSYVTALKVERTVMRLILMLIVIIAAMNIISGLVMLVKNKGRDIAILRTMGATQGAILRVFFMVGASIGVAGTIAGFALGVLFCLFIEPIQEGIEAVFGEVVPEDIYFFEHLPAKIEWPEVLVIVFSALLASCLATLPPALRAARLDPVEALRYE